MERHSVAPTGIHSFLTMPQANRSLTYINLTPKQSAKSGDHRPMASCIDKVFRLLLPTSVRLCKRRQAQTHSLALTPPSWYLCLSRNYQAAFQIRLPKSTLRERNGPLSVTGAI